MISTAKKRELNDIDDITTKHYLGNNLDRTLGVVAVTWDFAKHGGEVGLISLGQNLPANAIVRVPSYVGSETVAGGATTTLALHCGDVQITPLTGVADFVGGPYYTSATLENGEVLVLIPDGGELKLEVALEAMTAGSIRFFVEYLINQDTETLV